jgi:uncharacterized protein (DUF779 family)
MYIDRVKLSDEARSVIEQLRDKHGELIFHQSGGCCDGSAPMCFPKDDFLIGSRDLCLGEIHGCRFYMAPDQFEYYRNMQITIEVTQGRGSSFSLEIPLGVRFMTVSRVLTDQELEKVRPLET